MRSTTSIDHPITEKEWLLYPNPTTDQVTISHQETRGVVYVYDQSGMLLDKFLLPNGQISTNHSLKQWPQGMYRFVMQRENKLESVTVTKI